ncbi:hypothetical protein ACFQY0_08845 [Haloferula chungangensis]|uniref:Uncharacterized protein n=1 Tax=Haloferula chungangensis TaxID=1048331 RepID=A0ABW2L7N9_9BACT
MTDPDQLDRLQRIDAELTNRYLVDDLEAAEAAAELGLPQLLAVSADGLEARRAALAEWRGGIAVAEGRKFSTLAWNALDPDYRLTARQGLVPLEEFFKVLRDLREEELARQQRARDELEADMEAAVSMYTAGGVVISTRKLDWLVMAQDGSIRVGRKAGNCDDVVRGFKDTGLSSLVFELRFKEQFEAPTPPEQPEEE